MNALIAKSNEARAILQEATGLDDLEYHLLVLETGCTALDELVRPTGTISEDARLMYREHMVAIGWWTWYEMTWRAFEVRLAAEWTGPESLIPHQPTQWKRERLLAEAHSLHRTAQYDRAFEVWMKMIEDRRVLTIPPAPAKPENQPLPKTHTHHAHH